MILNTYIYDVSGQSAGFIGYTLCILLFYYLVDLGWCVFLYDI